MDKLMEIIKTCYPHAQLVEDEANCDYSVKFEKYGTVVDKLYFAIAQKNGNLELYRDSTGLMTEIIEAKLFVN